MSKKRVKSRKFLAEDLMVKLLLCLYKILRKLNNGRWENFGKWWIRYILVSIVCVLLQNGRFEEMRHSNGVKEWGEVEMQRHLSVVVRC